MIILMNLKDEHTKTEKSKKSMSQFMVVRFVESVHQYNEHEKEMFTERLNRSCDEIWYRYDRRLCLVSLAPNF